MKRVAALVLPFAAGMLLAHGAFAQTIEGTFSGSVIAIGYITQSGVSCSTGCSIAGISVGTPISGQFSYDTTAIPPNTSTNPSNGGVYNFTGGNAQFSIDAGGFRWQTGPTVTAEAAAQAGTFSMNAYCNKDSATCPPLAPVNPLGIADGTISFSLSHSILAPTLPVAAAQFTTASIDGVSGALVYGGDALTYNISFSVNPASIQIRDASQLPISQTQVQPSYEPVPSGLIQLPPTGKKKALVLITHGWNSNVSAWANDMAAAIREQITLRQASGQLDQGTEWFVWAYDWNVESGFGPVVPYAPKYAYGNAFAVGNDLASKLAGLDLQHIHFIAHSAGSNVIDTAASELKTRRLDRGLPVPTMHSTFLDAYNPNGDAAPYGADSDWAEQYVDSRGLDFDLDPFGLVPDNTDLNLRQAFNFDITKLDPTDQLDPIDRHSWPYRWYQCTVGPFLSSSYCFSQPASSPIAFGFPLSLESGVAKRLADDIANYPRHLPSCELENNQTLPFRCNNLLQFSTLTVTGETVIPLSLCNSSPGTCTMSETGIVSIDLTGSLLSLENRSPAWIDVPFDVREPMNVLRFDYVFSTQANGLLTVFWDDSVVFRADQRNARDGRNDSRSIALGPVVPGVHHLGIRLDSFNGTLGKIQLSNLRTGLMKQTLDAEAPVTTASVVSQNADGWSKTTASVNLYATDGVIGSGVKQINYATTGAQVNSGVVAGNVASVDISAEGSTSLTYFAMDNAGNTEVSKSVTVKIDKTLPTTVATLSQTPNPAGWNRADVTVTLNAADSVGGAGIKRISYVLAGSQTDSRLVTANTASVAITTEGVTTVSYFAADNADNSEVSKTLTVKIDKSPPEASIGADTANKDLKVSGRDNLSGLSTVTKDASGNYTITDVAGHTTRLLFKNTYANKLLTFAQLTGMQYDSAPVVGVPTTSFAYTWDTKVTPVQLLSQTVVIGSSTLIQALYDKKANVTTVQSFVNGKLAQKSIFSGLEIVKISTKNAVVDYQF